MIASQQDVKKECLEDYHRRFEHAKSLKKIGTNAE